MSDMDDFDLDLGEEIFDEDYETLLADSPAKKNDGPSTFSTTPIPEDELKNVPEKPEEFAPVKEAVQADDDEDDIEEALSDLKDVLNDADDNPLPEVQAPKLSSRPSSKKSGSGAPRRTSAGSTSQGFAALPPAKDASTLGNEGKAIASDLSSKFGDQEQQFKKVELRRHGEIIVEDNEEFQVIERDIPTPESRARRSPKKSPRRVPKKSPRRSARSSPRKSPRRSDSRSSSHASSTASEETIARLTQTNHRLREQLVKLSRTLDQHLQQKGIRMSKRSGVARRPSTNAAAMESEMRAMHRQNKMYRKANADLKSKLYTSDSVTKISRLKNQLVQEASRIRDLRDEIRSLNNITREQSKRLEVLDNGNDTIIRRNENAIRVQKAEARKYRTENKKYLDQVQRMRRQMLRVRTQNDKYKKLMEKHDLTMDTASEIDQLRAQLEAEKEARKEADRKREIATRALASMKRRHQLEGRKAKNNASELRTEISKLEGKLAHHRYTPATSDSLAPEGFQSKIPKPTPTSGIPRRRGSALGKKSPRRKTRRKSTSKTSKSPRSSPSKTSKSPSKSPRSSSSAAKTEVARKEAADLADEVAALQDSLAAETNEALESMENMDDLNNLLDEVDAKAKALDDFDKAEEKKQKTPQKTSKKPEATTPAAKDTSVEKKSDPASKLVSEQQAVVKAEKPAVVEPSSPTFDDFGDDDLDLDVDALLESVAMDDKKGEDDFDPYTPF